MSEQSIPRWRQLQQGGYLALLLALLCALVSGCAALQRERETRYMPERTNPVDMRAHFASEYAAATQAAIADPSKANIVRMVDSGSATSAISCGNWMLKNVLAKQGILMKDGTAAAVGAATTIAAGAFSLSPGAVAGVGLGQMIVHLFGQVESTGLGAPDTYLAQAKMRTALGQCSTKLLAQAKAGELNLAGAVIGIDACYWVCTPDAATAITTQALAQTEIVVEPSGAMSVTSVSSPALKDANGARLIAYWFPGGVVDRAAEARIKAWQAANGIDVSIPFLAHSALYAAARAKAVIDLGIP